MKSIHDFSSYSDDERISYLKEQWGFKKNKALIVTGTLKAVVLGNNQKYFRLFELNANGIESLEYPLLDLAPKEKIINRGIFVTNSKNMGKELSLALQESRDVLVRCELVLAYTDERDKYGNPLLLQVKNSSLNLFTKIDKQYVVEDESGDIQVERVIYNTLYIKAQNKLEEEIKLKKISEEHNLELELGSKKTDLENAIADLEGASELLEKDNIELATQKLVAEKNILEKEEKHLTLTKKITQANQDKNQLKKDIDDLKKVMQRDKEEQMNKLEKFRSYVKSQADKLLSLEFIDEKEYNEILMISNEEESRDPLLSFKDDFDRDFSSAISHIQAFLFNKDILYPRHIIEDFFALVQTNDLIILAGESGSGKTNLIKSFASAVGGVSKIIPVKPNWTSSEDLLGYYNPLEKKYLSTPFLDALLEASKHPDTPYFICLDEMNLARVEYYFADFLSLLEERDELPEIQLYSDDESSHVLSEFSHVMEIIKETKDKYQKNNIVNFVQLIQDDEINLELKRVFGFSDKDSLIKYHSDLRRMISGIINIPSTIIFPKNVRIIGAINIDETTHYLSPKILDRAHIMKFDSPLLFNWKQIETEIKTEHDDTQAIKFDMDDFGTRNKYPRFEMKNGFCQLVANLTEEFFSPLGIEVGLRTIRQGLNYQDKLSQFNNDENLFINNFIVHKILPKMTFDGSKMVGDIDMKDLLLRLQDQLTPHIIKEKISLSDGIDAVEEFDELVNKSKVNDWIVNYWA